MRQKKKSASAWLRAGLWLVVILMLAWLMWQLIAEVKRSGWDGERPLILGVVKEDGLEVWQWHVGERKLNKLILPGSVYLSLAQGYGRYRVEAIAGLDRLEKKEGELIRLSLQEGLGIGVDGVINSQFKARRSRLNWWDWLRWKLGMLRGHREDRLELAEVLDLVEVSLPDGSAAYEFDSRAMDELAQRLFAEEGLRQSQWRLAVINATDHAGLGARVKRLLENMGLVVVNVTDTLELRSESEIGLSREVRRSDYVVERLRHLLEMPVKVDQDTSRERADIAIWVGEDYWQRVFEP